MSGPIRIGNAEREDAVERLGEHFAAGRLTEDEYTERSEQAYAAQTERDLSSLFTDLPGGYRQEREQRRRPGPRQTAWGGPPWAGGPPWLGFVVLAVVAVAAACAIVNGHFPFFLIPLGIIAWVVTSRRRRFSRDS